MIYAIRTWCAFFGAAVLLAAASAAQTPASQPERAMKREANRQAVLAMARPIDMHDTVWIEDMTLLEVRDSLKAGKTTALIFAGGMEDNGPYVTVSQHNSIVKAMCDSISRKLGNALCAPVVGMGPGHPEEAQSPGSLTLSAETFKAVLTDTAVSLKAEGFKNVLFLVDHGGDVRATQEAVQALSEKWSGSGTAAYYVPEFYDYTEVEKYESDVLGVHEKPSGPIRFHDDYYTAAISVAIDPDGARMPERIRAKQTTVNGIDLAGSKAAADGKKIMKFREDATTTAIRKLVPVQ